jgi:hypothetical protein
MLMKVEIIPITVVSRTKSQQLLYVLPTSLLKTNFKYEEI